MDKKLILKLEQIYSSTISNFRGGDGAEEDVPNTPDDKEYKTNIPFSLTAEDVEEPVIKTKKGKTVLREPPDENPEENEIEKLKLIKKEPEVEIDTLDKTEIEEMINTIDEEFVISEKDDKEVKQPPKTEEEDDDNGMGDLANDNMGEQNPASGEDPNANPGNADPSQMMGGDQGMNGMTGMGGDQEIDPMTGQPKKTAEQVGRIFELKKIYSRLLAIESQLSFSSDIVLLKIRKFVSDSIELFETLISNIDAYKDDVDEIIVMYYSFLEQLYEIMKKYYKNKQEKEKEQNKKK
jgi:hypothetical protein